MTGANPLLVLTLVCVISFFVLVTLALTPSSLEVVSILSQFGG